MLCQRITVFFSVIVLFFTGCGPSGKRPDVSRINIKADIFRFDQAFSALDTLQIKKGLTELQAEYPEFLPVYLKEIMNFRYNPDSLKEKPVDPYLTKFIASRDVQSLQKVVDMKYNEAAIKKLQEELTKGFRYFKYYDPDFRAPKIITFISGLANYGVVTVDSILGIGLDMFMGADFPLYQKTADPYPGYILNRFNPENILPSAIKVLYTEKFPLPDKGDLLEQMIGQGKMLYFLDKVLPDVPDSLKINYSGKQLEWCIRNEQFIWQYFIKNALLYKKDFMTIAYYIGPGPSSRGMPKEAPGDIGSWVGWQIVKAYMKKHSQTSLDKLIKMKGDAQFLSDAGYHPH